MTIQHAGWFNRPVVNVVILMICWLMAETVFAGPDTVLIRRDGVGELKIGAGLPKLENGRVAFDRVVTDEQGRASRMVGVVVGGQVVKVEIDKGRIWRLTISEPGLRTHDRVGVGTPIAIVAAQTAVNVEIGSGADLIILPMNQCGLAYWSSLELDAAGLLKKWDANAVAALPATVTVRAILVTGRCSH